jgi:hypothetical protein
VKDWVERRERVTASEHNTTIAGSVQMTTVSGSHFAIAGARLSAQSTATPV